MMFHATKVTAIRIYIIVIMIKYAFAGNVEIEGIRIGNGNGINRHNSGVVYIDYDGEWRPVCQDTWGQKEALVACRQLQYIGGWPIEGVKLDFNASSDFLTGFNCAGTHHDASTLEECTYRSTSPSTCPISRLIRIQCFQDFQVNLANGSAPNIGEVEVSYDDTWYDVCYDNNMGITWSFSNVQVVCRELGFPGAMLHTKGKEGANPRQTIVNSYKCSTYSSESSLKDCLRESPITSKSSCGAENVAIAVCAVPGYMGCFKSSTSHPIFNTIMADDMNIDMCRRHCRVNNHTHAHLQNGDTCFCADALVDELLDDKECAVACRGDSYQVCGDNETNSVYHVNEGACSNPLNTTDVYYYGDLFECGFGLQLIGATSMQCIMGNSSTEVKWSREFPGCEDISKSTGSTNKGGLLTPFQNTDTIMIIGITVGAAVLVCLILVILLLGKRKRNRNSKSVKTKSRPETSNGDDNRSVNTEPRYQEITELPKEQNDQATVSNCEECTEPPYAEIPIENPKPFDWWKLNPFRVSEGVNETKATMETPTTGAKSSLHYHSVKLDEKETDDSGADIEKNPTQNVFPDKSTEGWAENVIYVGGDVKEGATGGDVKEGAAGGNVNKKVTDEDEWLNIELYQVAC